MHHIIPVKISIPQSKPDELQDTLVHDDKTIVPFYYAKKKKEKPQVGFEQKGISENATKGGPHHANQTRLAKHSHFL